MWLIYPSSASTMPLSVIINQASFSGKYGLPITLAIPTPLEPFLK